MKRSLLLIVTILLTTIGFWFFMDNFMFKRNDAADPERDKLKTLEITEMGTSTSKGVTSTKYGFKTKEDGVIEIGTERHSPSRPYVRMDKWDNEVSLKVGIPFETGEDPMIMGDRLRYSTADKPLTIKPLEKLDSILFPEAEASTPRVDIEVYAKPAGEEEGDNGGVEFDTILYEKPASNEIVFPIEVENLNFYYQPPLNEENKNPDLTCTETECKEKGGHTVLSRKEDVIGSYAVYHAGNFVNYVGGKKYRAGKAYSIYRPKVYDAEGNSIWGTLDVDTTAKTLTVGVDQDWLNNAIYPVTIDPTFGDDTTAGSFNGPHSTWFLASGTHTGGAGTGTSMFHYSQGWDDAETAVYTYTGGNYNGNSDPSPVDGGSPQWWGEPFEGSAPTFSAVSYRLLMSCQSDYNVGFGYDSSATATRYSTGETFSTWPSTISYVNGITADYSIYVVYDVAGTDTPTPTPSNTPTPTPTPSNTPTPAPGSLLFEGVKMEGVKIPAY